MNTEIISRIEWSSVIIERVGGLDVLVLMCETVEQSVNLFMLLKDNNYSIGVRKENGKDCFVILFDDYELGFEPNSPFNGMQKLRDGLVTKITTGFTNELGQHK